MIRMEKQVLRIRTKFFEAVLKQVWNQWIGTWPRMSRNIDPWSLIIGDIFRHDMMMCLDRMWYLSWFSSLQKDTFWFEVMCSVISDVMCKDLSWYDVTATGDFASRMTEDLNKMQDGMGEKVLIIQHFTKRKGSQILLLFKGGDALPFHSDWYRRFCLSLHSGGFCLLPVHTCRSWEATLRFSLRTGFSLWCFSLWSRPWPWWGESLGR